MAEFDDITAEDAQTAARMQADVGAEHHGQSGAGRNQALSDERGCDQAGGGAALNESSHTQPRQHRRQLVVGALLEHATKVLAKNPQHSGPDRVSAPDQQGNGGKEVQQVLHGLAAALRTRGTPL